MAQTKTTIKKVPKARVKKTLTVAAELKTEIQQAVYFEGVGGRKTSVARVRIFAKGGDFLINQKTLEQYFPTTELKAIALSPFKRIGQESFGVSVIVKGGGIHSQAEAVRHGISNALLVFDSGLRKKLKTAGFLTRDARMRERKKFGLKRARRAPQWQKR